MVNNIIGDTIKKKRKELNLTQEKLAEFIESDAYYISRIETCKKKMEKLSENDKKIVLLIMEMLIDRFASEE